MSDFTFLVTIPGWMVEISLTVVGFVVLALLLYLLFFRPTGKLYRVHVFYQGDPSENFSVSAVQYSEDNERKAELEKKGWHYAGWVLFQIVGIIESIDKMSWSNQGDLNPWEFSFLVQSIPIGSLREIQPEPKQK